MDDPHCSTAGSQLMVPGPSRSPGNGAIETYTMANQPKTVTCLHQFHTTVHVLNLHTWKLSSVHSERKVFQTKLCTISVLMSEHPPPESSKENGLAFACWCRSDSFTPVSASVGQIADFLIHLY